MAELTEDTPAVLHTWIGGQRQAELSRGGPAAQGTLRDMVCLVLRMHEGERNVCEIGVDGRDFIQLEEIHVLAARFNLME